MSDVPGGTPPPPPPPPPMMGGPQGGIAPKGLGEILSAAFNIYKANASKLLLIVAIVVVPLSFLSALSSGVIFAGTKHTEELFGQQVEVIDRSFGLFLAGALVAAAISIIITAVLQAAILRAAAQATIGDPVDPEESYRFGFKRLGSVILVSILVGLAVAGGFILLIIPGIIFLVLFSVSVPVLIVENRRGRQAMSRSWNLAKGHFWHAFGVIIVAGLITGFVSGIIGSIGGSAWVVRWIFTAIGTTITAPFSALVSVLLYLDLRARSESLSADTLRAELAAAGSSG